MSLTDRLLVSILGALIVWLIKAGISHLLKRAKLRAALLADVSVHLAGVREQQATVAELVETHAIEGRTLPFPISYRVGEYLLYRSIQEDLLNCLSKVELVKVVKFYQKMWELDVAINGMASTLGTWERDGIGLSADQVVHLKRRKARIDSFCQVFLAGEIGRLTDLPDDYRSVEELARMVAKR